ncbi:ribonuclease P protein subunit p40-like [Neocloeon triangulifer]|uniref:ribonuclease P protein subunit p40-like n=1 Tax=Neocloeon triangulifer TaxID=2078957 RepID=UPI00286F40E3|nr:ribonuclease P protein subunit p40-like [Neocloeon triangulifer]
MLAPEVWNFKPPSVALQVEKGSLKNARECVEFCVSNHYFNHSVSLILPSDCKLPISLSNGPGKESEYYKIRDLPVLELISPNFIRNFVKQGNSSALSIGTNIDSDTCVCLTPTGMLVLSLERVAFERLGLEGKPSFFCRMKPPSRYVVKIDLTETCFKPNKKNYERVVRCLMHNLKIRTDMILSWDPPDSSVCPSSVASYFSSLGYEVSTGRKEISTKKLMEVQIPKSIMEIDTEEALEWLGAISVGVDTNEWCDLSTGLFAEEDFNNLPAQFHQWTGFYTSRQITSFLEELMSYFRSQKDIPWISLSVQGFEDSAVHWKLDENYFHQSAENSYSILLDHNGKYVLWKTLGANRKFKTKSK